MFERVFSVAGIPAEGNGATRSAISVALVGKCRGVRKTAVARRKMHAEEQRQVYGIKYSHRHW